jgi:hypothetical protein
MIDKTDVKKIVTTKQDNKRLFILTSGYYSKTLDYFLFLIDIAKESFPELEPKDIKINHYTGRFHKGQCGIEFSVVCKNVPDGYEEYGDRMVCTHYPT